MKKLLFAAMLAMSCSAHAGREYQIESTPIEPDATDRAKINVELSNVIASFIRDAGYRCDSVGLLYVERPGVHYWMSCNRFKYSYDVMDRGGHWTVRVKD